ncbi:alpha/beta hydrolase [Yoonia sediminilitoris]|uniref:Putative membrane protein n=1 Tax=Yoonia sediminilitoris TaxID=1286148 RepID=A0A2T6KLZ0_9RHOB|nr:alpha/beta-hydrolase family protein [Yoonia sediminilitoris]PUB17230.1 putative membrane protein [Yoonia sediminilitoris]RCW97525.1 putative membrane protein [Yoonia sediminilitoris]
MSIFARMIGPFSIPCFLIGVLFFAASLTPSLIPRDPDVQGILGGLVTALGYLLGQVVALFWRALDMPGLPRRLDRSITFIATALIVVFFVWVLNSSLTWQNDLREKMGMSPAAALNLVRILVIATLVFALAFAIGRIVASFFRLVRARLYRVMPPRRANVVGFLVVAVLLVVVTRDGILDGVIAGLDTSYETAQALFDDAPPPPTDAGKTGSSASLIDWSGIGTPGRDFIMSGPDAAAISAFTGRQALEPIRVYVGRANGDTPIQRAELALEELKRQGAFERSVLIITSPTGTGWMDPGSHDPVEYMHNGDIATVAAQYSYLQSPLALVLETNTGLEQATALQDVVHGYWKTLPEDARPRLYVHGLSLGAWSSMHATNLFRLLDDPIDGAFWAGPPFPSDFWNYVQNQRSTGSPWVLPKIGDGSLIRYASHTADASEAAAEWGDMRIVFLQYSSDPVVFYDPASVWRAPPWMRDPPAEDMSEHFIFMPVVSHFQLALDMALSFGSPPGHGHAYYAQDYIGPWIQVTDPEGWTDSETTRLRSHCNIGFQFGCSKGLP